MLAWSLSRGSGQHKGYSYRLEGVVVVLVLQLSPSLPEDGGGKWKSKQDAFLFVYWKV